MSGHTPGPWRVNGKQSIRGPSGEYVAKTNWNNGQTNARLIAAAPELLHALRMMLQGTTSDCGIIKMPSNGAVHAAFAAIAKATGTPAP